MTCAMCTFLRIVCMLVERSAQSLANVGALSSPEQREALTWHSPYSVHLAIYFQPASSSQLFPREERLWLFCQLVSLQAVMLWRLSRKIVAFSYYVVLCGGGEDLWSHNALSKKSVFQEVMGRWAPLSFERYLLLSLHLCFMVWLPDAGLPLVSMAQHWQLSLLLQIVSRDPWQY